MNIFKLMYNSIKNLGVVATTDIRALINRYICYCKNNERQKGIIDSWVNFCRDIVIRYKVIIVLISIIYLDICCKEFDTSILCIVMSVINVIVSQGLGLMISFIGVCYILIHTKYDNKLVLMILFFVMYIIISFLSLLYSMILYGIIKDIKLFKIFKIDTSIFK